jgi:glycerophosphoryl diester phosphodiesterase
MQGNAFGIRKMSFMNTWKLTAWFRHKPHELVNTGNIIVGKIMVQSFDWRTLEILHREAPEIKTMYLTMDFPSYSTIRDGAWTGGRFLVNHQGSVPQMIKHSAGQALGVIWAPNFQNLTPETLREAKALGMLVIPWTVNETLHMRKLIEGNVDGIITDYPNLLRGLLIEKGLSVPKALP